MVDLLSDFDFVLMQLDLFKTSLVGEKISL